MQICIWSAGVYIYIYIYIYVCVCVCVCMKVGGLGASPQEKFEFLGYVMLHLRLF